MRNIGRHPARKLHEKLASTTRRAILYKIRARPDYRDELRLGVIPLNWIKGKSTMIPVRHSLNPGAGTHDSNRAVFLSVVFATVVWLSSNAAWADADSTDARATASNETVSQKVGEPTIRRIGPVTTVTEVSSGLPFPARVDTGATTCSIHYEAIEIEDAAESPQDNVGKRVRILIRSPEGNKEWVSTKIVEHVTVRTTTDDDPRYKVQLKLRWQDVEKKVLVTLSDREKMKYPMLLGRNFLKGDFLVDVAMAADE